MSNGTTVDKDGMHTPKQFFESSFHKRNKNEKEAMAVAISLSRTLKYCEQNKLSLSISDCVDLVRGTNVEIREIFAQPLANLSGIYTNMKEVVRVLNACQAWQQAGR